MMKKNQPTDVTKKISLRMPPNIYNRIAAIMNDDGNRLKTKTDVIKFALKHALDKERFQTIYKIDHEIRQNNIDLFAEIHNYMGNENAYTSAINHIGVNINQIAHRINGKSKSGEPHLDDDNLKAIKSAVRAIQTTKHEIEANQKALISDELKILGYFDKDKAATYRKMTKSNRRAVHLYKHAQKTYRRSLKLTKRIEKGSDR